MPPSLSLLRYAKLVTLILSISKIIPTYSRYIKKELVYIAIASPTRRQPSSYAECIKANMRLSYDIRSISNTKYTRYLTLRNLLVPYLIYYRVSYLIYY